MHEVFRAGVQPGAPGTDSELKMLICHLLFSLGEPLGCSALVEILAEEGIANYFEAASAASALVKSGHIELCEENREKCYQITEIGQNTAQTFEKNIPLTLREKALFAAQKYLRTKQHKAQNNAEIKQVSDGFLLTLTIQDVGSDLLSVTILLPTKKDCEKITERFYDDPLILYKGIVALLTGNYDFAGKLVDNTM